MRRSSYIVVVAVKRPLAQDRRQLAEHRQRHRRGAELVPHAVAVAARVLERGARQRDHLPAHRGPRLAVRELRGSEDLAATRRLAHLDAHALGERLRLAGKPPAFRAPLRCQLAQFDARRRAELTGSQAHQALAARPAAGTVDGQCHRRTRYRGEERVVTGDLDGDADGLYEDLVHGDTSFRAGENMALAERWRTMLAMYLTRSVDGATASKGGHGCVCGRRHLAGQRAETLGDSLPHVVQKTAAP